MSQSVIKITGLNVTAQDELRSDRTPMPTSRSPHAALTKRERSIMDALYRLGRATAAEIIDDLPGTPNSSTVRTQLRVLEAKGHVRHEEDGLRYVYMPTVPRHAARRSALKHLVDTFFEGSSAKVVAALLGGDGARVSDVELTHIAALVDQAREDQGPKERAKKEPR
jgi:predicted transcriptional regulator